MPPRRSSRAASVKPASKSAAAAAAAKPASKPATKPASKPAEKATSRPASRSINKRAASPERSSPPPAKRAKADSQKSENEPPSQTRKSSSKPPSKAASRTKTAAALKNLALETIQEKPQKPYFNPLPSPPEKHRPGLVLFAWGAGNFGQFGMGPDVLDELDKPKRSVWVEQQIEKGSFGEVGAGLESIVGGGLHSIMIDEKGVVWTCGVNDDAALGRITSDVPDPENPSSFLSIDNLTSYPHPLQSLINENFRAVKAVAGDSICAVVSDKGELRVWGSFRAVEGSLGFASGLKHQFIPAPILELSHKPGDVEKVSSIAAGNNHLVVLTTHGSIYTWGAGEQAQLGRKVLERRKIHGTVPEKVTLGNRSRKAVVVGAGSMHSFAVDDKGDVWGWGLNSMGQTGTGYSSDDDSVVQLPQKVLKISKEELGGDFVVDVDGGEHHTLFLTNSGKVYACGRSNGGQLGLADDDEALKDREYPDFLPEPALITFPDMNDPVVQISCGPHNNSAVTEGGALYSWGQGTQGELGVPEEEVRTPRVIVRKEGGAWFAAAVACGGQHTLGLFRKKEKA
ncbi:regulator of chromosome condensation 1/beta-lactamase-inhibitor protein II [Cyathus striatus]|nr:regulator of chromosome condensation 1/beta-lactamase-inhibitor protein II [Cyathus striatus]